MAFDGFGLCCWRPEVEGKATVCTLIQIAIWHPVGCGTCRSPLFFICQVFFGIRNSNYILKACD